MPVRLVFAIGSPGVRTLAIGDIHGCKTALEHLVDYAGINRTDRVITLGDYVDRGPDSKGCIEFLLGLKKSGQLIQLRGNHEIMMLKARDDEGFTETWCGYGGAETLASYGVSGFDAVPDSHWDFIESSAPYYETANHFFVHANARPDLEFDEQPEYTLFWESFDERKPHKSGKVMVCGHTAQRSGVPLESEGRAVCIDTCVYGGGWLTCLDIESGRYWQCNESRERREGAIDWWTNSLV